MIINLTPSQMRALSFLETLGIQIPPNTESIVLEKIARDSISTLEIRKETGTIVIRYSKEHLFYRGMFLLLPQLLKEGKKEIAEQTPITEVGYSLDASRNGVMKVPVLQKFIAYLAIIGFNTLYLYTEDTYEAEGLPYLGYLRGRYSQKEIQEIVTFAKDFGMEVVPSIQTLAHLTPFLRWPMNEEIKDDANTILIGEAKTYEVIEKMILACKEMYQTNRIHLGMDEAYQAGLGNYLEKNGYKNRTDLMIEHIQAVEKIAKKHQLKVLIWSDFIYKLLDQTKSNGLYPLEAQINLAQAQRLPADLTYVHWDYGGEEVEKYEKVIQNHLEFCDPDHYIFAGGAHIWNRLAPNHGKSIKTIQASITACRNKKIRSVMLTTWGDDGQETDHWHSFISAFYYTEQIYGEPTLEKIEDQFDLLFGKNTFQMMYLLRKFDEIDTVTEGNTNMTNISKVLLWQDCLFGIFDYHVEAFNKKATRSLRTYYGELADCLREVDVSEAKDPVFQLIKRYYWNLAQVLALKAEVGVCLRNRRVVEDREGLEQLQIDLQQLLERTADLAKQHARLWHASYKTNGWEVLELRYAGLQSRIQTTSQKIIAYLHDEEDLLEVVEQRLPFYGYLNPVEVYGFNYREIAHTGYY